MALARSASQTNEDVSILRLHLSLGSLAVEPAPLLAQMRAGLADGVGLVGNLHPLIGMIGQVSMNLG